MKLLILNCRYLLFAVKRWFAKPPDAATLLIHLNHNQTTRQEFMGIATMDNVQLVRFRDSNIAS